MVEKIMRWLMRKAGLMCVSPDYALKLHERMNNLETRIIELDSVICSTMECVEEIRDAQQNAVPTKQSAENVFGEMLTEYLYGYQQKRSDDE